MLYFSRTCVNNAEISEWAHFLCNAKINTLGASQYVFSPTTLTPVITTWNMVINVHGLLYIDHVQEWICRNDNKSTHMS